MTWLPDQTLADFATVARLAGVSLAADAIRIEALPGPTRRPLGCQRVRWPSTFSPMAKTC